MPQNDRTPHQPLVHVTVTSAAWERLRKLTDIPHKHGDGTNECAICDVELVDAAVTHIEELDAALRKFVMAKDAETRAALTLATAEDNFTDAEPDRRAAERAMVAVHDACADATALLAKYGRPIPTPKTRKPHGQR